MPRSFTAVVLALVGMLLVPGVAHAQDAQDEPVREPAAHVVLSGDVFVPRGRAMGEVVVFSGSVTVNGVVRGDVIVLDGPITVGGQVSGDVVAVDGNVRLQRTAQVAGSVIAGGRVEVVEGADVAGSVREGVRWSLSGPVAALGALLASFAMAISILVLLLLMLLLVPRGLERVAGAARTAPFASAGWGLLIAIVAPVLAVVAAASILGSPLGLAVLLALGFWFLVGLAATSWAVGRAIVPSPRPRIAALFAGWGIAAVLGLVPFVNVAVWGLGSIFGIGLLVVAAWRTRGSGRYRVGGIGSADRADRSIEEPALAMAPLPDDLVRVDEPSPAEEPAASVQLSDEVTEPAATSDERSDRA
jgi:hypothetical protein